LIGIAASVGLLVLRYRLRSAFHAQRANGSCVGCRRRRRAELESKREIQHQSIDGRKKTMSKPIVVCASMFVLITQTVPALAIEQTAPAVNVSRNALPPGDAGNDCEARIEKLDASNAEGEERLAEKNEVIDFCDRQYERDHTIKRLIKECAKFEEQPVVKQQSVAECQLAAFKYANALRTLKREYKK
jgi:hypothetical protein